MKPRTRNIGCGLVIFLAVVMTVPQLFLILIVNSSPTDYRLSFPAEKDLTDQDAIDLSRQALFLHDNDSQFVGPINTGHTDSGGHPIVFSRKADKPDAGWSLWRVKGSPNTWNYMVSIRRVADHVICRVSKAH